MPPDCPIWLHSALQPLLLTRQRQHEMRYLPYISTHPNQIPQSNPKSFNLESVALSIQSRRYHHGVFKMHMVGMVWPTEENYGRHFVSPNCPQLWYYACKLSTLCLILYVCIMICLTAIDIKNSFDQENTFWLVPLFYLFVFIFKIFVLFLYLLPPWQMRLCFW